MGTPARHQADHDAILQPSNTDITAASTCTQVACSAKARKTISDLLEQLDGWLTQPQVLREVRAVEAMERNDSPAARQLLEDWANGDPKARLTREAKAGLKQKQRMAAMGRK